VCLRRGILRDAGRVRGELDEFGQVGFDGRNTKARLAGDLFARTFFENLHHEDVAEKRRNPANLYLHDPDDLVAPEAVLRVLPVVPDLKVLSSLADLNIIQRDCTLPLGAAETHQALVDYDPV
jgi:hypothetical protein